MQKIYPTFKIYTLLGYTNHNVHVQKHYDKVKYFLMPGSSN